MKIFKLIIIIFVLLFSNVAFSDDAAKIEAEKMIESMGLESIYQETLEAMLDSEIKQKPQYAPFRAVILKFMNKHASYKILKPSLVEMYAGEFTCPELAELKQFYDTPVGKKSVLKIPAISAKGKLIGDQLVRENMKELEQMIKEESERIRKKM